MIKIQDAVRKHSREWCRCCCSDINTKRISLSNDDGENQKSSFVLCENCANSLIEALEKAFAKTE